MFNWIPKIQYPGSELFNYPAPAGYGVTSMPVDLPAYFGLGNRHWTSNFGFETQHNIYNGGYDYSVYFLAQNPQLAQTDPLLTGLTGFKVTPYANFFAPGFAKTLAALETTLESILKSDKLNDEQKSKLQEQLDKVKAMKEKVEKALEKNPSAQDCLNIKAELAKLNEEVNNTVSNITEEIEAGDGNTPDSDLNLGANGVDEVEEVENPVSDEVKKEALSICENIYKGAIGKVGTDYDLIGAQGIDKLTKDNVVTMLRYWADQYKPLSGDDNIIETIFDEEMLWNNKTNTGYITKIFNRLEERAKELKVYDKLAGQFISAYDELDDTFVNEKVVKTAFETIFKAVEAAEIIHNQKNSQKVKADEKKAEAQKAESEKKAKAEKEAQQKETKARETFLTDMKEIWKDEKAEISEKVQYENGKFKIRIEGKDYSADSFKELANKIQEAGYDPELYLKKRKLDKTS